MAGKSYRDLTAWQKAMKLVTAIYATTEGFPKTETFGLSAQVRRAAVSVPSNIEEGQGRDSPREFLRHLSIAYGSLMETETQLQIAANLGFLTEGLLEQSAEVGGLINGLSHSLRKIAIH